MSARRGPGGALRRTLRREAARAFYDRLGRRQDAQAFYEDAALDALVARAELGEARAVYELGCGTGRFAERLLARELPADARYLGVDLSATMVGLARERLARFGERAEVVRVSGEPHVPLPAASFDRYLTSYVLDLLPVDEIEAQLAEAHRLLAPGGLLGAVSLTRGVSRRGRLVTRVWEAVHALGPALVGGCRPLVLEALLPPERWRVRHRRVLEAWGIASELLVAEARPEPGPPGGEAAAGPAGRGGRLRKFR